MPLAFLEIGTTKIILKISGKEETRSFLEKLGFTVGTNVTVISQIGGNLIVNIRDTRVAISKEMAMKITV